MKTLRRVFAVGVVTALASAAFAGQVSADHTDARLTLAIDPVEGPPGTTINAQLPAEAYDPAAGDLCAASNTVNQAIAGAIAGLQTMNVQEVAQDLLEIAMDDPEFAGLLDSILFPLVFATLEQEQLGDPAFWDPDTGQGSLEAPATNVNTGEPLARPALYAVAGTCLGINPDLLTDAASAAVETVATALNDLGSQIVDPLIACLLDTDPVGCMLAFLTTQAPQVLTEIVPSALETLLLAVIDQDPDIAWAALYCLQGDNGEPCPTDAPPPPAPPVDGVTPRFTG